MSEDRADRLSRRRRERSGSQNEDNTGKARDSDNTTRPSNTSNTENTDELNSTSDTETHDDETVGPLRETAETQMMRLTNDQYRELHHVYNRLKADYEYEFDEEFELNRHYFPLLLHIALPKLREFDAEELRDELKEID